MPAFRLPKFKYDQHCHSAPMAIVSQQGISVTLSVKSYSLSLWAKIHKAQISCNYKSFLYACRLLTQSNLFVIILLAFNDFARIYSVL